MSVCEGCCDPFIQGDIIATCCVCLSMYHCNEKSSEGSGKNCSSASSTEVRVLKLKSKCLMLYRCKECRNNGGMSPQLVEVVSNLKTSVDKLSSLSEDIKKLTMEVIPQINGEVSKLWTSHKALSKEIVKSHDDCVQSIDKLEEKFKKLENDFSAHVRSASPIRVVDKSGNADLILNEITERKYRENNILIYNIPEQTKSADTELVRDYDLKQVLETLKNIKNINTKLGLSNVKRLGAFNSEKMRPVLVKFDCRADATNVITHWRMVPRTVSVSYDLTKLQRDRFNVLREQAKLFNLDVSNKKNNRFQFVGFRNGNPFLVTSSSLRNDRSTKNAVSGSNSSAADLNL